MLKEKKRYIINAPQYRSNSAGIRVLYELNKQLILWGYESIIIMIGSNFKAGENDIVIYPEIVDKNPLEGKKIVRYILNEPQLINKNAFFTENEVKFVYHPRLKKYSENILFVPCIEDYFKNYNAKRNKVCYYIGKYNGQVNNHKDWIQITNTYPSNRKELAKLLNETHTFITYDNFTMLIDEALYCGCEVYIIEDNIGLIKQIENEHENNKKVFNKQLNKFIEITQEL